MGILDRLRAVGRAIKEVFIKPKPVAPPPPVKAPPRVVPPVAPPPIEEVEIELGYSVEAILKVRERVRPKERADEYIIKRYILRTPTIPTADQIREFYNLEHDDYAYAIKSFTVQRLEG